MTKRKVTKRAKSQYEAPPASVLTSAAIAGAVLLIFGIGTLACGLEAFEQFFRSISPDCGMAFARDAQSVHPWQRVEAQGGNH